MITKKRQTIKERLRDGRTKAVSLSPVTKYEAKNETETNWRSGVDEHKGRTEEPRPSASSKGKELGQVSRHSKARIRTRRRYSKFTWLFGATVTVCALLYWEQAALLYVLSTLAICGLLLAVAFSNLEDG